MRKSVLVLGLLVLVWSVPQVVSAESSSSPMFVIVADADSVRGFSQGSELTGSFVGLVSALHPDHRLAFISTDDPSGVLGPVAHVDPEFNLFRSDVDAALAASATGGSSEEIFDALSQAFTVLGIEKAPPGSVVYLITGGSSLDGLASLTDRVSPLAARFGENGWPINGVTLPDTSPEVAEFVSGVVAESGGSAFELSVPEGLEALADSMLGGSGGGSLVGLIQDVLEPQDLLTSSVTVTPGTGETTLVFFKEDPFGTVRLSNPSGLEVAAGDPAALYVEESPHVVAWKLVDPEPGRWKLEIRGVRGRVSAWHVWSNRYFLVLDSSAPLPVDDPSTLIAYASDETGAVELTQVRLFATITRPDGTTLVHEMNDQGVDGDAIAGDGLFAVVVPPLGQEGDYRVDLEMSFLEFDHRISTQSTIRVRNFPVLDVTAERIDDLRPGERTKVASVFVHVAGEPYPVSADQIIADMQSSGGAGGVLEIEPQRLFGEDTSWLYDVYFTPGGEGLHTLTLGLSLDYAGRQYSHLADSIFPSSTLPPQPVELEPVTEVPIVAPVVEAEPEPPVSTPPEPAGFPWWVLVFPALIVLAALLLGLNSLIRTRPFGYLYTDQDELVVDFSRLRRHPVMGLLLKNYVNGKELKIPGLEGVWFRFGGKRIGLRTWRSTGSVRVNNQPLIGEATIQNRAWIGTHGKLYSFLLSPPTPRIAGSQADDD